MSGRRGAAALVLACLAVFGACSQAPARHPSVAQQYLTIAQAGNRALERDFDALEGRDADNLKAAQADLRDAAATEHLFDRRLGAIDFPAAIEATAHTLVQVNEARAALTSRAATATSLAEIGDYQKQLDVANRPVEDQVKLIRRQLGLPPPAQS